MTKLILTLLICEEGQGVVEYGLIISLIILAAIGALELFGVGVGGVYETIRTVVVAALS